MLVSDVLQNKGDDVVTTSPGTSIVDAARLFSSAHIGAAVVLEDNNSIVGLVSERDIVRYIAEAGHLALSANVDRVMTSPIKTCKPDDKIDRVMERMTRHRLRHFPVLAEGRLAGIISIGDVVKHRLEESDLEIGVLRDVAGAHVLP